MVAAVARPSLVPTPSPFRAIASLLPRPAEAAPAPPRTREERAKARKLVAIRCWVCALDGSKRGYVLDLSESGARIGGVGTSLVVGTGVLLKLDLGRGEPTVALRGEVSRYHAVLARSGPGCPELCVRFVDVDVDQWFSVARFLDATR